MISVISVYEAAVNFWQSLRKIKDKFKKLIYCNTLFKYHNSFSKLNELYFFELICPSCNTRWK